MEFEASPWPIPKQPSRGRREGVEGLSLEGWVEELGYGRLHPKKLLGLGARKSSS